MGLGSGNLPFSFLNYTPLQERQLFSWRTRNPARAEGRLRAAGVRVALKSYSFVGGEASKMASKEMQKRDSAKKPREPPEP